MNYRRVIPRDLFNEANLLKCYGQLYLELERLNIPGVEFGSISPNHQDYFNVQQWNSDGSTSIVNIALTVNSIVIPLYRPLNSREPYPLYTDYDDECIDIFTKKGKLTKPFLKLLKRKLC